MAPVVSEKEEVAAAVWEQGQVVDIVGNDDEDCDAAVVVVDDDRPIERLGQQEYPAGAAF